MALTSRISLQGPPSSDPEDFLSSSLGVIFPDDVTNQHGDAQHSLLYTSPRLPRPLRIALADPDREADRKLFSHYLWNASLLLAEFVEAGTLGLPLDSDGDGNGNGDAGPSPGLTLGLGKVPTASFSVADKSCLELGAGTALPSLMAALLGARGVVATDYPSPTVLATLRANVAANARPECSPPGRRGPVAPVAVEGHAWGDLDTPFAAAHRARYDRVFACDCLWMPWQHGNLLRSVAWFLKGSSSSPSSSEEEKEEDKDDGARAWVVAGFHTGRAKMRGFFEDAALAEAGLELEHIWERDCDGREREWAWDRGQEDVSERKRWLVVGMLRRRRGRRRREEGKDRKDGKEVEWNGVEG